jgi:ubiquinone/menaquinone biosynthesis C-methylase UbiE
MNKNLLNSYKWPKILHNLTEQQKEINDDFMKHWHEVLPQNYGVVDRFNHNYVVKNRPKNFKSTLEIGAGIGEHLEYEVLSSNQLANYYAIDIRENMILQHRKRFPNVNSIVADCQSRMPFDNASFDRIIAIHVLEHLPNLPAAINEIYRLLSNDGGGGTFSIVIPCEGSMAYSFCRKISAQRIFEKRYKQSYKWFIEQEHINSPAEIFQEIQKYFNIQSTTYFPIPIHLEFCNLCIGATFKKKFNF